MALDPTDFAARRLLADEARRLLRAIRLTEVDGPDRDEAVALVAEAAALLERKAPARPLWQTGLTSFDDFDVATDPSEVFPFSPSMGALNPMAPPVRFEVGDDGIVQGEVTFTEPYNGPPFDLAHGGAIALVYDDLLGLTGMLGAGGGLTARLAISYEATTPMLVPIQLKAWTGERDGRKFTVHGEMRHEGQLLTHAEGLFIAPRSMGG